MTFSKCPTQNFTQETKEGIIKAYKKERKERERTLIASLTQIDNPKREYNVPNPRAPR